MKLTPLGATGLVGAVIGALSIPIALIVSWRTEVDDLSRWLPFTLPAILIVGGVALAVAGRRPRRRHSAPN